MIPLPKNHYILQPRYIQIYRWFKYVPKYHYIAIIAVIKYIFKGMPLDDLTNSKIIRMRYIYTCHKSKAGFPMKKITTNDPSIANWLYRENDPLNNNKPSEFFISKEL